MPTGRERAALAAEARLGELGLRQKDLADRGIDGSIWRDFVKGRSWPNPRTRAKIEVVLWGKVGKLAEIAANNSEANASITALLAETDDPDERALLLSNLDDATKKRLYVRLIHHGGGAAETLPESGSG